MRIILFVVILAAFVGTGAILLKTKMSIDTSNKLKQAEIEQQAKQNEIKQAEVNQQIQQEKEKNDSTVKTDVGVLATALTSYYQNHETYPIVKDLNQLVVDGDLRYIPTAPQGGSYNYLVGPPGCSGTKASSCKTASVSGQLSVPTSRGSTWCWQSKAADPRPIEVISIAACQPL